MSLVTVILAPLMVLLPAAGSVAGGADRASDSAVPESDDPRGAEAAVAFAPAAAAGEDLADPSFRLALDGLRDLAAQQVRIEQRVTIRVIPRPSPIQRNMLMDLPDREIGPRLEERKIGKCLPVSGIAGVQTRGGNQLLLFMRDQRIVTAELERACRARDFYSGFYLSRSDDDRLCVDRDTLLSRSGANCKVTRIRQLVESED